MKNTGLNFIPPFLTDYVAGAESGIVYKINLLTGNWTQYLPKTEQQAITIETMACATFSAMNTLETQFELLFSTFLAENQQWMKDNGYFDETGKINFSDRFIAKLSGTTLQGNYLQKVWDTVRNCGLVPEKDWPFVGTTFAEYYSDIPQVIQDKGLEFKKRFKVMYEWVLIFGDGQDIKTTIQYHLKQAPLQIATPVCAGWETGNVKACDLKIPQHATMIYSADDSGFYDFDEYVPFDKLLSLDYPIMYALKGIVEEIAVLAIIPFDHIFNQNILFGETSQEVVFLQTALKKLGFFKLAPTGFYGNITRQSVLAFQKANQVATDTELNSLSGRIVGVKTRAKLNTLLSPIH